ncbi:hypothetical protein F5Y00DRAFT_177706 [Daldinia vernicosa]|uniref:uncharacterized protein n=1 Tax=Daldinia vernicosa TaxID=114800 RepID=UPI002007BC4B|nr:uncharacterized protein F5Y00DRAFT_177706 [Daldinia vernicosa]KAI0852666.1 hypothetical protein F5Y00DRAFT_177706 [Daldinia vernicosa]
MASSPAGSSSQQQPTFSHTNGKKTTMADPYGDNLPNTSGANTAPSKKRSLSIFDVDIDAHSRSYSSTPASEYPAESSLARSAARYTNLSALDTSHPPSPDFKLREQGLDHQISVSTLSTLANDAIVYPVTIKWPLQGQAFAEQPTQPPPYKEVEDVKPESPYVNEAKRFAPAVSGQNYLHGTQLSSNYRGQSSSSQQQDNQGKPDTLKESSEPRPASNQSNGPVKGKRDRIWPWKKGTCRKIAGDTWQNIKAFFGHDATPKRSRGPSGSHQGRPAPKDPYDNGFLSAPRSTPCPISKNKGTPRSNAKANGEGSGKKTARSARKWLSKLL